MRRGCGTWHDVQDRADDHHEYDLLLDVLIVAVVLIITVQFAIVVDLVVAVLQCNIRVAVIAYGGRRVTVVVPPVTRLRAEPNIAASRGLPPTQRGLADGAARAISIGMCGCDAGICHLQLGLLHCCLASAAAHGGSGGGDGREGLA